MAPYLRIMIGRAMLLVVIGALVRTGSAQMTVLDGTGFRVAPGTTMHLDLQGDLEIAGTAEVTNDGLIIVAPGTSILEPLGAPISGSGIESATDLYATPLSGVDPGGLGLEITTTDPPGTLVVERGHLAWSDTAGRVSVERWYRVSPQTWSGSPATIRFHVDPSELNGISFPSAVMHVRSGADSLWAPHPGWVDQLDHAVEASVPDSLGTFTVFEGMLPTGTQDHAFGPGWGVFPSVVQDHVNIRVPAGEALRRTEVLDLRGRCILAQDHPAMQGVQRLELGRLASGSYLLRVNQGPSFMLAVP